MNYEMKYFFSGKKILITGNTGFKGTWLTRILLTMGAEVTGYSLDPPTIPALYHIADLRSNYKFKQIKGDIRDLNGLKSAFKVSHPDIVLHLAAQPIVRDSYRDPVTTYSTNVMGTVNILECVRLSAAGNELNKDTDWKGVKSFLNVTTDKVYKNNEWEYGYREIDILDGFDPYSNSKSCSELVTHSYKNSFFQDNSIRISTARAGNVIGGGDFSNDRIIPDSIRAIKEAIECDLSEAVINIRNPYSIRPYQHVIEPLFMYLTIAMKQYEDEKYCGSYNIGPGDNNCVTTSELVSIFCNRWNKEGSFPHVSWKNKNEKNAPHEAKFLRLDCSKIKRMFGWQPKWHIDKAIEEVVRLSKVWMAGGDVGTEMDREIEEYIAS